jgi:hypothetical protein
MSSVVKMSVVKLSVIMSSVVALKRGVHISVACTIKRFITAVNTSLL